MIGFTAVPAAYVPDAELEAKKEREIARLRRRDMERQLSARKSAKDPGITEGMFGDDFKPANAAGQINLF